MAAVIFGTLAILLTTVGGGAAAPPTAVAGRTLHDWSAELANPRVTVRLLAVRSLPAFGAKAVRPLTVALPDGDAGVRAGAAGALGEIGPAAASAQTALQALLDDRSVGVVLHAAYALYRLGVRGRPVAVLAGALEHPTRGVANTAAELLGRAEAAEALPALAKARHHADYHIKEAAVHASARIKQRRGAVP